MIFYKFHVYNGLIAKTGTTVLLPDKYEEFKDAARNGLKDEQLGAQFGFSWATARKYRLLLAPETRAGFK